MALIICSECGKQISDKAAMCLGCGAPVEAMRADGEGVSPSMTAGAVAAGIMPLPSPEIPAYDAGTGAATATVDAVGSVAKTTARTAKTFAASLLDQNGDGRLDQEDVKILASKSAELAKSGAKQVGRVAKEASQSDSVKGAAAGALVGAAIGSVVPFVGTATVAAVGAAAGFAKGLMTKN